MKNFFVLLLLTVFSSDLEAQDWVRMLRNENTNLYSVDSIFHRERLGKEYVAGQGVKQFNRWKNFWEPRLFPSGNFADASSELLNFFSQGGKTKFLDKNFGNWISLGLDDWSSSSYNPGNGRINCIFQEPDNSDVIYIGAASGGLWRTSNQGDSWEPLTDNIPSLGISGIAVDYTNPDVIYIATGDSEHQDVYGVGVLKSEDNGATWATTGLSWELNANRISVKLLMHPQNPQILFCATSHGLFKTINGGLSWESVLAGFINDVEFKPGDPSTMYCTKEKIYISTDSGDNFDVITHEVLPASSQITLAKIAVTASNPEVIYYFCADNFSGFQGLYKSNDAGTSWTLQSDSPNILNGSSIGDGQVGQAWYDMTIAVSPFDENIVVVGGVNLWKSINSGINWNLNSYWFYEEDMSVNFVHADIHYLDFVGQNLYCGSDGGIFLSQDNSQSYVDLSAGLVITQFTKLGVSPQNSNLVIGGAQDNGTNILSDDNWTHVMGADGGECAFLPSDSMVVFCSTQNGGIRKSTNGGLDFESSTAGISEDGPWVTPFIISPLNENYMYAGFQNVWRSTSQGDSWSKISDFNEPIQAVAMGLNAPNTIYTASFDNIYRTTNGGNDWENISSGLPNLAITGITLDPLNVSHLWVSLSGFSSSNKVFYSANGGDDWTNVTANLPNFPVNCILFDEQGSNGIYVGTDQGVYYTNDNLAHWEPFMNNLPRVSITELEIHQEDQAIFASTYGRGIWRSDLFELTEAPQVDFTFEPAVICEGMEINFTDLSSLATPNWQWSFEGANNEVSTSENPVVTYNNQGNFDVSLTVSNALGTNTLTCQNCVYVYPNNVINLPYSENFDSDATIQELNWFPTADNGWKKSDTVGWSGNHSIWLENYQLNTNLNSEIISQPFYLNGDHAYFSFKYSYAKVDESNNEKLRLYSSINCGENWSLVQNWSGSSTLLTSAITLLPFSPSSLQDWNTVQIELDESLLGENVMFKFKFINDYGNNIFIDDINIADEIVDVLEAESSEDFAIYPNPVNRILHVVTKKNNATQIYIYNSFGELVQTQQLNGKADQSILLNLPAGLYYCQLLKDDSVVYSRKFFSLK